MIKFTSTKNASVLSVLKEHLSKTMIGKIKQNGATLVDGKAVKMSHVVNVGQEIVIKLPEKSKPVVKPYFCDIKVAYEDDDVIVLEKPVGMPTHTSKGNNETTLENAYCGLLQSCGEEAENITFHAITRLDSETSGLVLVGKNPISTAKLSSDMQSGKIVKTYLCIARGEIKQDFTCEIKMARVEKQKPYRWQSDSGKNSITHFKTIKQIHGDTLLVAKPQTGRTHQIRVHLAYSGHAIVGDKLYQSGGILKGEKPTTRLMLHMWKLEFWGKVVVSEGEFGCCSDEREKR